MGWVFGAVVKTQLRMLTFYKLASQLWIHSQPPANGIPWEAVGDGSSHGVPVSYMENPEGVPCSWFWPTARDGYCEHLGREPEDLLSLLWLACQSKWIMWKLLLSYVSSQILIFLWKNKVNSVTATHQENKNPWAISFLSVPSVWFEILEGRNSGSSDFSCLAQNLVHIQAQEKVHSGRAGKSKKWASSQRKTVQWKFIFCVAQTVTTMGRRSLHIDRVIVEAVISPALFSARGRERGVHCTFFLGGQDVCSNNNPHLGSPWKLDSIYSII